MYNTGNRWLLLRRNNRQDVGIIHGGRTFRKKVIDDVTYAVSIDADKSGNVAAVSDSGKLSVIRDTDVISQYVPADGSTYTTCTFDEDGILYAGTSADSIDVYRVDEGIPTLIDITNVMN